jgi:osmoprotectant transport system substrate-binding protein/osmoprotectant transport system permease protein
MLGAIAILLASGGAQARERVTVGSKAFPESWILGEALATMARSAGCDATHRANLGGTEIVAAAARSGAIDVYPEYTGTLREVLLHKPDSTTDEIRARLSRDGLSMTDPLGFDDSYAIAVAPAVADKFALRAISDLVGRSELRAAFTHEFLGRSDGWGGLRAHYGLQLPEVRGVQHELAFEAVASGQADVVDVYTTDPQIDRLHLRVLADDRSFFPRYEAVVVYRLDLEERAPQALVAIRRLVGHVDRATMARANAAVADHASLEVAAGALLRASLGADAPSPATGAGIGETVARDLVRHVELVGASLAGSVGVGIPIGILAAKRRRIGAVALGGAGVLQTIPSLALLALLIPLFGIGVVPAVVALFVYGLLPIVQGTYTGLTTIPVALVEAAQALGLPRTTRLLRIELPLASPSIVAGIRTSAVIAVGTATIAALVGAGGLGDPILRGITLRSAPLILSGAVPSALLALVVQGLFAGLERVVVPRGLRLTHAD